LSIIRIQLDAAAQANSGSIQNSYSKFLPWVYRQHLVEIEIRDEKGESREVIAGV